uniref:Uncharacterized protein n=1 Tax=Talaromyces marneffei PM1 TaxID=1077442 RepID=A0A093V301_TALMA
MFQQPQKCDLILWFGSWPTKAMNGEYTPVFLMASKHILREDSALQLLLIIDMICDWARDIYRKDIMKCFASAVSDSRGFTPADSHISYNTDSGEESPANQSNGGFSTGDSDSTTSQVENEHIRTPIDPASASHSDEDEDETSVTLGDLDPSSEVASTSNTTSDANIASFDTPMVPDVEMVDLGRENVSATTPTEAATQHAVIKYANDVVFSFNTLALPEAQSDLMRLLTSSSTTSDIAQTAGRLVMLFCGRNQILTRRSTIRYLESWWIGSNSAREQYNSDLDDDIVMAHFSFESYFRQQDWELVRKLTCIMASSNTIETLARISKESIYAPEVTFSTLLSISEIFVVRSRRKVVYQILSFIYAKIMPASEETQNIGAFLAKKPNSWPDSCPKYSLVVFDQSNTKDGQLMASKISEAVLNQAFFHENGSSISPVDARAFTFWTKLLRGELPVDSVWRC